MPLHADDLNDVLNRDGPFLPGMTRREFLAWAVAAGCASGDSITPVAVPSTLDAFLATSSPAAFAHTTSGGRWHLAPHLALINRYLLALAARQITRLIITLPPRHGKSSIISRYLPAWWLGTFPDQNVILMSYGADLATFWSARSREVFDRWGPACFRLHTDSRSRAGGHWGVAGHDGWMEAVGVGGSITGKGAHLMVVDDPIKNAEEADSPLMREKTWDWFNSTAYTRLEPGGVCVVIVTRWHQDDMVGRIIKEMAENPAAEKWTVINLPALAVTDEQPFPHGIGRKTGEALWPARYDLTALTRIRNRLTTRWWNALYMQRPTPPEGGMFKAEWLKIQMEYPGFTKEVRYWDMASTEQAAASSDPDWTVGVRLAHGLDDLYYVRHMERFRASPGDTEDRVFQVALMDGRHVPVRMEQEGGAAGKIATHHYKSQFRQRGLGLWSYQERPTMGRGKVLRAEPWASACEHGKVRLVNGNWDMRAFIEEHCVFPFGAHDDIVDAASGGFSEIYTPPPGYPKTAGKRLPAIADYEPR